VGLKASGVEPMIRLRMQVSSEQVESVQRRVSRGEYEINCQQVATAMLERIGATVSPHEVVTESEGGRALLRALSGLRAA
jgi:hypothetical protein